MACTVCSRKLYKKEVILSEEIKESNLRVEIELRHSNYFRKNWKVGTGKEKA
jgi:hypothetical protein